MTLEQRDPIVVGIIPDNSLLNMAIKDAAELAQQPAPGLGLSVIDPNAVTEEDDAPENFPDSEPVEINRPFTDSEILIRLLAFVQLIKESMEANPGFPIARAGRVSTNSTTYQRVAIWTISVDRTGRLLEVSMVSNTPVTAQFRLLINGEVQFNGLALDAGDGSMTMPFEDNVLRSELEVELLVVSDGSTTIIANGSISGIEKD